MAKDCEGDDEECEGEIGCWLLVAGFACRSLGAGRVLGASARLQRVLG